MGKCDDSSMRLISTIDPKWRGRRMTRCEYQSKSVANVGRTEPSIKSETPCIAPLLHCLVTSETTLLHTLDQTHFLIRSNTGRSRSMSQERVNVSSIPQDSMPPSLPPLCPEPHRLSLLAKSDFVLHLRTRQEPYSRPCSFRDNPPLVV